MVTQVVSYLGYPGFCERGTFMSGGSLVLYLIVLLLAVFYSCQHVYLRLMSFDIDIWAIKSLMSDTAVKKA